MPPTHRIVTEDEAEIRLDRYLRRHFPALTQGVIQKLLRSGHVRIDGKRAEAASRLVPGQSIRIPPMAEAPRPPAARPALDEATAREMQSLILYQDEALIVLNKPAGLPVQGGPGIVRHLDAFLEALQGEARDRPRLVHRLDKETSGVLLLARSPGIAAKLAAAFRGRDVEKTYWALVIGRPPQAEGRIEIPLLRLERSGGRERVVTAERGEPGAASAMTEYRTLDAAAKRIAWLALNPLTGRTHQLRVHCAAIGTPILGDAMYRGEREPVDGLPDRLHLHARALRLPHPKGGVLEVEAALPPHMAESFATLGFQAPAPHSPQRA